MGAVVRYYPLSDLPVLHQLPDLHDLACELMSADGIEFIGTVVHFVMLHVCTTDCRRLDLNNNVLRSAFRLRHIYHPISTKLFTIPC